MSCGDAIAGVAHMVLKWLDTKRVRAFAAEIGADYARLRKSVEVRQDSKDKRRQRYARLFEKVRQFERDERPNFYQRAVFLQALRSGMADLGVPPPEVAEFVSDITVSPLS
jgi:hypothetical protein